MGPEGRRALLEATTLAEVLQAAGLSEEELLVEWAAWVERSG